MIRTKGEAGTGDVVQAVRHMRAMQAQMRAVKSMSADELYEEAKKLQVPYFTTTQRENLKGYEGI